MIEESALLNDLLFQDCLEPIPNVPRLCGSYGHNPKELNGMISFLTTAYFRNSEFDRVMKMTDNMALGTGEFSIGASFELGCAMGRGESRSSILAKKQTLSPLFFATNYESKWVGGTDNCLVDVQKLLDLRTLTHCELKGDGKSEYMISVDVARSAKTSNNQTSICVGKIRRDRKNLVKKVEIVNIFNLPNGLNFTGQAIEVKRIRERFNTFGNTLVIVDANGIGGGLVDELGHIHIDPLDGKEYPAWGTVNTDEEPDEAEFVECIYSLKAQGINSDVIVNFINVVEGKKVELLTKIDQNDFNGDGNYLDNPSISHIQTDLLIEEVANLSLETLSGGKLSVKQNTKALDKDRYSSLSYLLFVIFKHYNKPLEERDTDFSKLMVFKQPKYR